MTKILLLDISIPPAPNVWVEGLLLFRLGPGAEIDINNYGWKEEGFTGSLKLKLAPCFLDGLNVKVPL